ncbi:MAG: anhydro-N-acetylmuramic acid kinase [Chitinispirillaceae bacterium]|nr:anhydro-N-acetylmuramic acid kinase [Chitinispirillaceae bacterium]
MMVPALYRSYKKARLRRLLVLSAGGESSGIHGLYFTTHDGVWEVIAHSKVPYPESIDTLIDSCRRSAVSIADLSWLDCKLTQLYGECAKTVLSQVPRGLKKPHLVVLDRLCLYRGATGEQEKIPQWNMSAGDPQYLAMTTNAPVVSDFSRYHLFAGGSGEVPTVAGDLLIAQQMGGMIAFLNIGLIAHLTVVDTRSPQRCVMDSDTGPGMCLINHCARLINCPDGFDRDGSQAAVGSIDAACLDALATSPWFLKEGPKDASPEFFDHLLQKPDLQALAPRDRLATITALTARSAYDFLRRSCPEASLLDKVIISGGGANNNALLGYCATYFGHTPVVSCEQLGIPVEMRVPLAIGLSVDSLLMGQASVWEDGKMPEPGLLGRFSMPA